MVYTVVSTMRSLSIVPKAEPTISLNNDNDPGGVAAIALNRVCPLTLIMLLLTLHKCHVYYYNFMTYFISC